MRQAITQPLSLRVALGAIGVMFLWALCFPLIAYGLSAAPPLGFAAIRALLAGLALLAVATYRGAPALQGRREWGAVVLVGLSATTLGFIGMFYGGARVAPGLATVIANTQPLFAALLLGWLGWERLSGSQWTGLLAGFAGIVLIGAPQLLTTSSNAAGILFILLGAAGVAISNIVLSRMAEHVDAIRAMGWQLVIGSVPLAILSQVFEQPEQILWSWRFAGALLTLSLLGTAAPFVLWFELLKRGPLNQLNVFTFFTPVFGLTMGVVYFAETITAVTVMGTVLCLAGVLWLNLASRRDVRQAPQALSDKPV